LETGNGQDRAALVEAIGKQALEAGFDVTGIAPVTIGARETGRLESFVAAGEHGDMDWMANHLDRRRSPRGLWPEVQSVIVLGMNYGPDENPLAVLERKDRAGISVYARNRDYHDIVKKRLKRIARWLVAETGCELKVFVDTAPVLEKPVAARSGIGWQGKHTNLVSRSHGSWLFLGEIFTTLDLPERMPETDHCGSCRRCLDSCPTDAFPEPYKLDARRCISYLTIEHKGPIPEEFRKAMGNRIYGCDDCLSVCPWNKYAETAREAHLVARDDLKAPRIADLLDLDDTSFRTLFSGSPIKRIGRDRFIRNVLIAAGNSDDPALLGKVTALCDDPSDVVRDAAGWAKAELIAG
jgi:epoxyqueuosine reductase